MTVKKKKGAQPSGHTWVFSHYGYARQGGFTVKVKFERCITPRHKHARRKTVVSRWKE